MGAKQLFSWRMLWLLIVTYLVVKGVKIFENYLCELLPEYCFLISKFSVVVLIGCLALFVFKPFAELFGLYNSNKEC